MRSVMNSVASIFASGLNPDVLGADTAAIAANVRYNFVSTRQVAVPYPHELPLQPDFFALHCREPSAFLVV